MPPHMPPLDAAAHRAFVLQYPKVTAFRMTALNVNGRGDLAYEHGSYDITAAGVADQGSYLAVWRQQPDGAWKVLRFMWNTDLPR